MGHQTNILNRKRKKTKSLKPKHGSEPPPRLFRPLAVFILLMIINMKIRLPQPQSDPNLPAYRSDISASLSHMFSNRGFLTKTKLKFVDIPSSHPHKAMFMLILLLSGDIESNPGPTGPAPKSMFPCAVCQQHVSWKHSAVECDNCDVWLHRSCASLTSSQYNRIEDESWTCYCCRSINPASFVFKAYNLNTSNSFEPLVSIPGDNSSVHL